RAFDVLPFRNSRALPRFERVIAIRQPLDPDRRRQLVRGDVFLRAERIARSLDDERGCAQRGEMRGARFRRLTGRMKRIAEADERAHAELVRDHARDAAAERLSADGDPRTAAEFRDDVAPRVEQYRLSIGRA